MYGCARACSAVIRRSGSRFNIFSSRSTATHTHRERYTDRQTHTQTERQIYTETDTYTDRQTHRETDTYTDRHVN